MRLVQVFVLLSPLLLLLSPLIVSIAAVQARAMWALDQRGVPVLAAVTEAFPDRDARGGMRVQYAFEADGPRVHHATTGSPLGVGMTSEALDQARAHGIAVRYLPEDPDVNEPETLLAEPRQRLGAPLFAAIPLLWGVVGTGIWVVGWRRRGRFFWLLG